MKVVNRALAIVVILPLSTVALAGDMLKPWASVIAGPNLPPSYQWTYESYESKSDCQNDNEYRLSKSPKAPVPQMPNDSPAPMEGIDENAVQLAQPLEAQAEETPVVRGGAGATMDCVYQGSKNLYILKLRNLRNKAVLCIAKEKKFRDYRVVLVGAPRETDEYRCE